MVAPVTEQKSSNQRLAMKSEHPVCASVGEGWNFWSVAPSVFFIVTPSPRERRTKIFFGSGVGGWVVGVENNWCGGGGDGVGW